MNLDARSITIGLSVVLLVAIGWVLLANSEEDPGETTVAAVTTGTSTTSGAATTVATTTTVPSTTAAASTTSVGTTTTITTTTTTPTTSVAPTTSSPTRSTVTIPPPLEEPDLTLCRENDIPDRQCEWVGVEYPKIAADPKEEPLHWLREYADFLNWGSANLGQRPALRELGATGEFLEAGREEDRESIEKGEITLHHTSIEGSVEVNEGPGVLTVEATVINGRKDLLVFGELNETTPAESPVRWRFELALTSEGWRVAGMRSAE